MTSDLADLPDDLFRAIASYLQPLDVIVCTQVSRPWRQAFRSPGVCRDLLKQHFPRAREVRTNAPADVDPAATFAHVACRYHHLATATPQDVQRLRIENARVASSWLHHFPINPWQRHLQFENNVKAFEYGDPLWTFGDGLLVFPSGPHESYVVYDLATGSIATIDLGCEERIIRRVRLCRGVLVVEWCEREPFHQLNENEVVFRHFASAYDLQPGVATDHTSIWTLRFRCEWKMHFLGLPLSSKDRFLSTHTDTHYALFLWQPNRSAWAEDEPIERLIVWDISSPSRYRPSLDKTGKAKPAEDVEGARVIRRLTMAELDFYGIRQRDTPTLTDLELDATNVYVHLEDHRWMVGLQTSLNRPRLHTVRTVALPFGSGPHSVDVCGSVSEHNAHVLPICERTYTGDEMRLARCWRHDRFPYMTSSRAHDSAAGIECRFSHCVILASDAHTDRLYLIGPNFQASLSPSLTKELAHRGRIVGDERFVIGENRKGEVVIAWFDRPVVCDWELETLPTK